MLLHTEYRCYSHFLNFFSDKALQKAFRTWKMLQFTRKRYKRVTKKKLDKSSGNWEKVLSNQGTHAEKMIIWRNVIELRRGFPEYTSEMCLKALITTNGDLTKAVPLLGSLDFAYQAQYGPPIAEDIKESINPYTKTYLSEESMEKMMMRNSRGVSDWATANGCRNEATICTW